MKNEDESKKQEALNRTLRDLRARVDTLAKSIYLIGGGALALSVNLYLAKKDELSKVVCSLKISWVFFLISILLFSMVTGCLIIQAYLSTEYYRDKIVQGEEIVNQPKRYFDLVALICGLIGFLLFILGLLFLIISATNL